MIATEELITLLAHRATPVQRMRPPIIRAMLWLTLAAIILTVIAIYHGLRPDLAIRREDPLFLTQVGASLLTGIFAAAAAFHVSLPDRSDVWLVLPAPPLAVWASTIGYGCLIRWIDAPADGFELGEILRCVGTVVLTSLPLSLVLLMMLRHAGPIRPTATAALGALSVAALAATAVTLVHDVEATAMVLLFNFGTAATFVVAGGLAGRRLLSINTCT